MTHESRVLSEHIVTLESVPRFWQYRENAWSSGVILVSIIGDMRGDAPLLTRLAYRASN